MSSSKGPGLTTRPFLLSPTHNSTYHSPQARPAHTKRSGEPDADTPVSSLVFGALCLSGKLPILTPMSESKKTVNVFTQNQVTFSRFLTFFRFFPQILLFLCSFLAFFPRFQLSAVAAKNRTKRASIHEINRTFLKIFLLLSTKRLTNPDLCQIPRFFVPNAQVPLIMERVFFNPLDNKCRKLL